MAPSGNIKVPPSHNKKYYVLPKEVWPRAEWKVSIHRPILSPSPSHLRSSTMEINSAWEFLIRIYKSFFFLLQCYFSQSFLSLLCFLLSVPFSPFWNPYSSHLRILDAALHISYLLPHDLILFIFLLFWNISSTWPFKLLILMSVVTNLSLIHPLSF